jgi:hypothetical protein
MPHLLVLKTPKVVLPFTHYKTTTEQQRLIINNVDEVTAHDGGPLILVTVYHYENRYAEIGCHAEQLFYYSKDKKNKLKFNCCEELTGIGRFSVRYLCFKPNVTKDLYEGIYGLPLKPKEEDIRTDLQEDLLKIARLNKDDILKNFNRPEYVLPSLSYCIADKLFPGDTPMENKIRLTYLSERSENRRLRMLKKYLFPK